MRWSAEQASIRNLSAGSLKFKYIFIVIKYLFQENYENHVILLSSSHVIVCIALIMIVLLQTGKGADMGAAFGGGSSQTLFGSTGASTFLSKATTVAAIIFMVTSLALAYLSSHRTR